MRLVWAGEPPERLQKKEGAIWLNTLLNERLVEVKECRWLIAMIDWDAVLG